MSTITVREATEVDRDSIAVVTESALAALRRIYRPNQRAIAHKRKIAESLTQLVALVGERIVGTVQYKVESDRLHFLSLSVHADFRRQGVARTLVASLARIGAALGARRLTLHTIKQTGNSETFEKLGFRVVSEERAIHFESDVFDRLTEVYMERLIE